MNQTKRRPLLIGASLLFAAAGCGDADYSEPDDGGSTSAETSTTSSETSNTSSETSSTTNPDSLVGTECDPSRQGFECDLNDIDTLYCDESTNTWVERNGDGGCFCYNGEIQCTAVGYAGIASKIRPQTLRTIRTLRS